MPEGTYTIDIPGFSDFIRIPALEDYELKRDRIERMRTRESAVPDFLQWIPSVITTLDDAQDLLFTGLVLAKPLLRRLPARLIPGLGWVLTANDALNLGTAVLGSTLAGRGPKPKALKTLVDLSSSKARRVTRVSQFLTDTQWFGFALQAPQAAEYLTGYGLQLGPLMGAISDTIWGTIRALGGSQVEFRGPPDDDVFEKSIEFLLEAPYEIFSGQILSEEDHTLLFAAGAVAAQVITERGASAKIAPRFEALSRTEVPVSRPWQRESIAALAAAGIRPDGPLRPFIPTPSPRPTFLEAAQLGAASTVRFEQEMRDLYGPTSRGTLSQLLYNQAGELLWEVVNGPGSLAAPDVDAFDKFIGVAIEFNIFPLHSLSPDELLAWFRQAQAQTFYRGTDVPGRGDLITSANEILGGWASRAIGWT